MTNLTLSPSVCPDCSAGLPPNAPGGLCPLCLIRTAMGGLMDSIESSPEENRTLDKRWAADFVSPSEVTLHLQSKNAELAGDPPTASHHYSEWTGVLARNDYAIDGDENFDITFAAHQNAFAMDYLDNSVESRFSLTFYDGGTNIGETSFTTNSFGTAQFIGFISSLSFDKVKVREDDGSENTDEYFQI